MNKKFLTIAGIILVLVGCLYYINKWNEERKLQEAYMPGIENVNIDSLKVMATEIEKNKLTAKTPEEKFNETKEIAISEKVSSVFETDAKALIEEYFGKFKVVAYEKVGSGNYFKASLTVPKIVMPHDVAALKELYVKNGFKFGSESLLPNLLELVMLKGKTDKITISISDIANQRLDISYAAVK